MRGSTGFAPTKALDEEALADGRQRFRFLPLHKRLASASARPAALPTTDYNLNLEGVSPDDTNFSHFSTTLSAQSDDNITASFVEYVNTVQPLSLSLPLLYRNRSKVITASFNALENSASHAGEATASIAVCIAALVRDLGGANFYPFFAPLVSAIARTLNPMRQSSGSPSHDNDVDVDIDLNDSDDPEENGKDANDVHDNSTFWQPEVMLVPLFSMLSEISKVLINHLVAHPKDTILNLTPLLAHSHYRVREMTAEASLGYIIRKTRDAEPRKALVMNLMSAASSSDTASCDELKRASDGLGVSLFEAIRLPSGRLHSRALDVLQVSMQELPQDKNEASQKPTEPSKSKDLESDYRIEVLARCFASLCRHISVANDAQSIGALVLTECDNAVDSKLWIMLAGLVFLLRKWIQFGGRALLSLLGMPFCQRILNFIVHAVEQNPDDAQLICESFGCIGNLYNNTSDSFREKSHCRAFVSALDKASKGSSPQALLSALSIVLNSPDLQMSPAFYHSLTRGVASVCNRLAMLQSEGADNRADELEQNGSPLALQAALKFFRLTSQAPEKVNVGTGFHTPALQSLVINILDASEVDKGGAPDESEADTRLSLLSQALEYLSFVPVDGRNDKLEKLIEKRHAWTIEDCANYLTACAYQRRSVESDEVSSMMRCSRIVIQEKLLTCTESWRLASVCSAVARSVRAFGRGAIIIQGTDNMKKETQVSPSELIQLLTTNLSSPNNDLRLASISLLTFLDPSMSSSDSLDDFTNEEDADVQVYIQSLREVLISKSPPIRELCRSFTYVLRVSRTLGGIGSRCLLLQELTRIVRSVTSLPNETSLLLTHFSLGLFHVSLKPLWQHAGELLNALGGQNTELVVPIIVKSLQVCESSLLREYGASSEYYENEDDVGEEDEDGDEESDDESDEKLGVLKTKSSQFKGLSSGNVRVSSRNYPESRKRKRTSSSMAITKRQKQKMMETTRLHWDPLEWKSVILMKEKFLVKVTPSLHDSNGLREGSSDGLIVVTEVIRALSKEPKQLMKFRPDFFNLYFNLNPQCFPRTRGNNLALSFVVLLEKMGGLKCSEADKAFENRMRARLLDDLCRNAPTLQAAALKCLCVSRSPSVKQHRDSFLRLIDDSSFREEMTLMTEGKFINWNLSEDTMLNEGDEAVIDVVLRICFSKMIGKKTSTTSRKSAVMSFITSKLPWKISLPKITGLILDPIKECVAELEMNSEEDFVSSGTMPVSYVQQGLLSSMETIIKHCRHTLPTSSWRQLTLSALLFLRKAGSGSVGQSIRSKVLRLLARMYEIRPEETSFATTRILSAMKATASGPNSGKSVNGAPALLRLMSAVFKTSAANDMDAIFEKYVWVFPYCSRVLQSPDCNVHMVDLSCDMLSTELFLYIKVRLSETSNCNRTTEKNHFVKVIHEVAMSFSKLFNRIMSIMDRERNAQKQWSAAFSRGLGIMERLVEVYPNLSGSLLTLADELGSFLQTPILSNISLTSTLKTLSSILRSASELQLDDSSSHRLSLSKLLPLLSLRRFTRDEESYTALCDLIATVGNEDLKHVSGLLKDLNSMSKSRLGEADLDTRIDVLGSITSIFKKGLGGKDDGPSIEARDLLFEQGSVTLSADSVIALLHGCIASIYVNDTAVRGTAGYAVRLISRWSAFCDSEAAHLSRPVVYRTLFDALLASKQLKHRREICIAFGEFVRSHEGEFEGNNWEGEAFFKHFKVLSNANDLETDMFENFVHLQAHRRSRALRQLEKHILRVNSNDAEKQLKDSVVRFASAFVLPISMQVSMDSLDVDGQKKRKNPKHFSMRENIQKDVSVWAVDLVGAAASKVEWDDYKRCLDGLLRKVSSKDDGDDVTVLYKLLVKVAEAFPKANENRYPDKTIATSYLVDSLIPKMLRHVNVGSTNDLLHHEERESTMLIQSGNKKDKSHNTFRAPIAVALGKLMTHLPEDNLETMMSLLVTPLTAALRSRMISTRDAAKKALTSVNLCLGPKYLYFVLQQVLSALSEGYRKDMCIYVVQSLLHGIKEFRKDNPENMFPIDDCVALLVEQIVQELKGGASDTRKDFEDPNATDTRIKQASARAVKAYECGELLGELILFRRSARALSTPFLEIYSKTVSGKLVSRIDQLMQRLLVGLSKNSSMTIEDALKFCHETVCAEEESDDENEKGKGPKLGQSRWVNFGLQLLNSVLSKNGVVLADKSDKTIQIFSMCQPFLPLCVAALKTGQDEVTLTSFRALQKLLKFPVPGKDLIAKEIVGVIINVLSQNSGGLSGNGDYVETNELFNTCLRSAAVLLKEVDNKEFSAVSKHRVDGLLSVACRCIESGSTECRSAAIALLRAVVTRKIVLPCVYDSVEKVNRLAVHSQSASLRSACISVSIQFLCTFPLGGRRVRQHLEFFVRNVNYELASGRLAALQAIQELIRKFPQKLLEKECEYLFVSLAANVARDSDEECRSMAFNSLRDLYGRLHGSRKLTDLLRIASTLIGVPCSMTDLNEQLECKILENEEDRIVRRCGLASLSAGCKSGNLSQRQLKAMFRVVVTVIEHLREEVGKEGIDNKNDADDETIRTGRTGSSNSWETWFVALQTVEAVFEASNKENNDNPKHKNDDNDNTTTSMSVSNSGARLEIDECGRAMWQRMKTCLLHRHQWVRLLAARLVGSHLSACGGRNGKPGTELNGQWMVWNVNSVVREWIKASCLQFEADHLSMELGKQCLKNVLCMADVVRVHQKVGDIGKQSAFLSSMDGHNGLVLPSDNDDDDDNNDEINVNNINNNNEEKLEKSNDKDVGRMLRWVVSRMCGIAVKGGHEERDFLRRGCALRFMLVSVKWWGKDIIEKFLRQYIFPIVKVLESGQTEAAAGDDKSTSYYHRKKKKNGLRKGNNDDDDSDSDENDNSNNKNPSNELGVSGVRMVAENLQSSLVECVGNEQYYSVYHELRSRVTAAKNERKRRAAVMVAVDGERAAKRKRIKGLKKRGKRIDLNTRLKLTGHNGGGNIDEIEKNQHAKRMLTEGL